MLKLHEGDETFHGFSVLNALAHVGGALPGGSHGEADRFLGCHPFFPCNNEPGEKGVTGRKDGADAFPVRQGKVDTVRREKDVAVGSVGDDRSLHSFRLESGDHVNQVVQRGERPPHDF